MSSAIKVTVNAENPVQELGGGFLVAYSKLGIVFISKYFPTQCFWTNSPAEMQKFLEDNYPLLIWGLPPIKRRGLFKSLAAWIKIKWLISTFRKNRKVDESEGGK